MTIKKYRLLENRFEHDKGTIVYTCLKYDYALAADDTYYTKKEHISATLDPAGGYPFFTVPVENLEELES